jgi:hypothetical protein
MSEEMPEYMSAMSAMSENMSENMSVRSEEMSEEMPEYWAKQTNKYKQFLIDMNKDAGLNITNNSDLLNIRDELLSNLNQFTYLLTFK